MIGEYQPSSEEKNWAMACHLTALIIFLGIPFGNLLGPLVVWLIKKDQYPLVDEQGKESMNYQISMLIYFIVGSGIAIGAAVSIIMLPMAVIWVAILIIMAIPYIIFIIIAAIKTSNGESYRYPLTIRFFQ